MKIKDKNYIGLLKFGKKEHMEALYNEGLFYMNTFDYFINLEDNGDGRADRYEATVEYFAGNGLDDITITLGSGDDQITLSRENGTLSVAMITDTPEYSHLYSMTAIDTEWALKNDLLLDERNFADGKDYVVIIHDFNKFVERLTNKLNENKWNSKLSFIEYIDEHNYSGQMGCFRKFDKFSYQNEWRCAVLQNGIKEPITITLGSLADIAFTPRNKREFYEMNAKIGNIAISNKNAIVLSEQEVIL